MIAVLGDVAVDVRSYLTRPLARGSDAPASIRLRPGGSAANVAVWLARLGAAVQLIGRVGNDSLGRWIVEQLQREGVIAHLEVDELLPTAVIQVLVEPDGERTMIPDRGASGSWPSAHSYRSVISDAQLLHITSYSLFGAESRDAALFALETARQSRVPISLDASSHALLAEMGASTFWELAGKVALLFANRHEAAVLGWRPDASDPFGELRAHADVIVVKMDREGCVVAGSGQSLDVRTPRVIAFCDSTGAGDAFAAGFLARWLIDRDLSASCAEAVRLGTQVVGDVSDISN